MLFYKTKYFFKEYEILLVDHINFVVFGILNTNISNSLLCDGEMTRSKLKVGPGRQGGREH